MRSFRIIACAAIFALALSHSAWAATYTVTNNNDSGAGSLRQAILDSDGGGSDIITFNAVGTITLASSLVVTGPNLFMGNSNDTIEITIDTNGGSFSALIINGYNVVVRNLAFIRTGSGIGSHVGIDITADSAILINCRVGTDWNDSVNTGFQTGVRVYGVPGDKTSFGRIGYRFGDPGEGCVISNNGNGITSYETDRLRIESNHIGTNRAGDAELPNAWGIILDNGTVHAIIGGTRWPESRNILCGTGVGISLGGAAAECFGNTVQATWMNVLVDGTETSNQFSTDILINSGTHGNYIGLPSSTGARGNLIAGAYISVSGTAVFNSIQGNTLTASGPGAEVIMRMPTANGNQPAPTITSAEIGLVQGTGLNPDYIEVFVSDRGAGEYGGALRFVGSATVSAGTWSLVPTGLMGGDYVTAISTDPSNNSSEFSLNMMVALATPTITPTPSVTPTRTITPTASPSHSATATESATITQTATISATYTITQTVTTTPTVTITPDNPLLGTDLEGLAALPVPNPAKESMQFVLHLEQAAKVEIMIFNLAGERVVTLSENLPAGQGQSLIWDCSDVAPGVYVARVLKDGKEAGKLKVAVVK